jgi:hypothetical protein
MDYDLAQIEKHADKINVRRNTQPPKALRL